MNQQAQGLLAEIRERNRVPRHVAIIMDGNGRWARHRGLPRWVGHREGMKAVHEVVGGALDAGLAHLTLYAFSQENWNRPALEVNALMALLSEYVAKEMDLLREKGVRVRVFGQRDRLTKAALEAVRDIEAYTVAGTQLQLNLAISYGSRAEITDAARSLAESVSRGDMTADQITEQELADRLWTSGWPDPDLLIRTSGELRISNFLLWQIAYSELYVTPLFWPDFTRLELFRALLEFADRDRRFGELEVGGAGRAKEGPRE